MGVKVSVDIVFGHVLCHLRLSSLTFLLLIILSLSVVTLYISYTMSISFCAFIAESAGI